MFILSNHKTHVVLFESFKATQETAETHCDMEPTASNCFVSDDWNVTRMAST